MGRSGRLNKGQPLLKKGESVTFRYRILIYSGIAKADATEAAYKEFVAAYH